MNKLVTSVFAYPVAIGGDWSGVVSPVALDSPEAKSFAVCWGTHGGLINRHRSRFSTLSDARSAELLVQESFAEGCSTTQKAIRVVLGLQK